MPGANCHQGIVIASQMYLMGDDYTDLTAPEATLEYIETKGPIASFQTCNLMLSISLSGKNDVDVVTCSTWVRGEGLV